MAARKEAKCYTCGQQILIEKPSPTSAWLKFNLDGSEHKDPRKGGGGISQEQFNELKLKMELIDKKLMEMAKTMDIIKAMIEAS